MPDVYTVAEAAARLDELIQRAAAGEEIIVEGSGDKAVRLAGTPAGAPAIGHQGKRVLGRLAGKIRISDDFDDTPDWLAEAFHHDENDAALLGMPSGERESTKR